MKYILSFTLVILSMTNYSQCDLSISYTPASCATCNDACVIVDSVESNCPPYVVTWTPSNPNQPVSCFGVAGTTYTATVTDNCGCTASDSVSVPNITGGPCSISLSAAPASCANCNDGCINIDSTGGCAVDTIVWYPHDPDNCSAQAGTEYIATLTDKCGCTTTDTLIVGDATSSINGAGQNSEFYIYPNPTKGEVRFEFQDNQNKNISVFDMSGKVIQSHTTNDKRFQINLKNNSKGLYLIKIQSEQISQTEKVIFK